MSRATVTRSSLPSPFRSAAATAWGAVSAVRFSGSVNELSPLPGRTAIVLALPASVGERDVRQAVVVEVARRHGLRRAARRERRRWAEGAVAGAEQDRAGGVARIGGHHIHAAVAVKVADG